MSRAVVEVFAEIVCPFTHVGFRRIVRHREGDERPEPLLRVRAWPLEWVNGEPMDPETVAQHVEELREHVEPDLFRGFDPAAMPETSIPAFELASVAAHQSVVLGERVSLALRDALFEEGRDVSDPAVLNSIRSRFDLPEPGTEARRTVDDDYAEGQRRGVEGSPEYFLDGRGYRCPALRMEEVDGGLSIDNADDFDAFLRDCFR
jgi:predicted DsbA family dithiol-disulfide isomerase